jgi:hypothetical protein
MRPQEAYACTRCQASFVVHASHPCGHERMAQLTCKEGTHDQSRDACQTHHLASADALAGNRDAVRHVVSRVTTHANKREKRMDTGMVPVRSTDAARRSHMSVDARCCD